MAQRVQLARALAMDARVLLMDEPFGALDAITKAGLQDILLDLHARAGSTIVFVTHDLDEALYLSDRVLVITGNPGTIATSLPTEPAPAPRPARHPRAARLHRGAEPARAGVGRRR